MERGGNGVEKVNYIHVNIQSTSTCRIFYL